MRWRSRHLPADDLPHRPDRWNHRRLWLDRRRHRQRRADRGRQDQRRAAACSARQLKLDPHNDDASATLSGQLFAKLVTAGAIAIAGSPDTGPVTAQLAIRHKIPTIGVVDDGGLTVNPEGPNSPPNPWVFDFGLNTFAWGDKIGEYALKHCPDGLAVLHDPSTYGAGRPLRHQAGLRQGRQEARRSTMRSPRTGRPAPPPASCRRSTPIKAAGIKCVDVWLTPQDQAAFAQDLHSAGYNAIVFGNDETNADDTFSKLAGDMPTARSARCSPPIFTRARSCGVPRGVQEEVQCRVDARSPRRATTAS